MNRAELQKLIDCCRPGSDDLHDPELGELKELARQVDDDAAVRAQYERMQDGDMAVAAAMHDVPVPAGLADRLLAGVTQRLASSQDSAVPQPRPGEQCGQDAIASALVCETEDIEDKRTVERAPRAPVVTARRRMLRWVVPAALLTVVAAVSVAAVLFNAPAAPVSLETVVNRALKWTDQAGQQPWNAELTTAPLNRYPLESSLRIRARQWQQFRSATGETVVAYDLAPPGKPLATQFTVVTRQAHAVPVALPSSPLRTTGGFSIGACQRGGVLYVLVVEGDAARYRQFVRAQLPVT